MAMCVKGGRRIGPAISEAAKDIVHQLLLPQVIILRWHELAKALEFLI